MNKENIRSIRLVRQHMLLYSTFRRYLMFTNNIHQYKSNRISGNQYLMLASYYSKYCSKSGKMMLLTIKQNLWFMRDGAPPHFYLQASTFLNNVFVNRWIDRQTHSIDPLRPPDLKPLDFHWSHLKSIVYSTPLNNVDDLQHGWWEKKWIWDYLKNT